MKKITSIISCILATCLIVFIIYFATNVKVYKTHGPSMEPTIIDSSFTLCTKYKELKRGDIVAFKKNGGIVIKRIIALPKEQVNIDKAGYISINGEILKEDYINNYHQIPYDIYMPHIVEDNKYFVLGDNRLDSLDSRFYGDIKKEDIICKITFVL